MGGSSFLFQLFLTIHLVGLALGLGAAFIADYSFFKAIRMADKIHSSTVIWMRSFSQVVWIGIGILAFSGTGMFLMKSQVYMSSSGFGFKMLLVLILIINGLFLNFYSTARLTTFNFSKQYKQTDAAWRARKLSFVFGGVSAVTWYSILGIAMFKNILHWPFLVYLALYLLALGGAVGSSLYLEKMLFTKAQVTVTPDNLDKVPVSVLAAYPERAKELIQQRYIPAPTPTTATAIAPVAQIQPPAPAPQEIQDLILPG